MIKLSIIIVNYNIKHFLEQSLHSIEKAIKNISSEIFVVDNNSVDSSVKMVKEKFPLFHLIENKENKGFAKANNQAIQKSKGEYVLLLNPDTVLEEDSLEKAINFMDEHPEAGALGVKMIDGKGNFLPESKRSLPTPSVAFYKIFGLSKLFPRSKMFGKYHLGYLDKDKINEVEVLSGAFMLIRKKTLDKTGMLDESFFMYGEDIDLSYRIIKAGYKNYYFPKAKIIHYKGESTKRGSLNYVRMFYNAMIIFAKKHLSKSKAGFLIRLIKLAIYFRAAFAVISRILNKIALPVLDFLFLYGGIYFIKDYWEKNHRYVEGGKYPPEFVLYFVPAYIVIWLLGVYFSGGYDKPTRIFKIVRGILFGTLTITAIYAFLPESWRFSRAIIALGAVWAIIAIVSIRLLIHSLLHGNLKVGVARSKKTVIVADEEEMNRTLSLLNNAKIDINFIGHIALSNSSKGSEYLLGTIKQLKEIVEVYRIDEIIFCSKDISSQQITHWMSAIGSQIDYKIVPEDSFSIIGSNSANAPGELYTIDINLAIASSPNKRNKKVLDILVSLALILTLPFSMLIVKNPLRLLRNIFTILIGKETWVGYAYQNNASELGIKQLPLIKKGILSPVDILPHKQIDDKTIARLNLLYAKDYSVWQDLNIIWKGIKYLGK